MSTSQMLLRGLTTSEASMLFAGLTSLSAPPFAKTVVIGGMLGNTGTLLRRGFSPYLNLPEPPLQGSQYTDVAALPAPGVISVLQGETASTGDIMVDDLVTSNQGYSIAFNGDGTFIVNAGGDTTVQYFNANIFNVGPLTYAGPYVVFINDPGPQQLAPIPLIYSPLGGLVSLNLASYVSDPIGIGLTSALTAGTLPTGVTLVGTLLSGFATTPINNTLSVLLTDGAGESITVNFQLFVYTTVAVPNVVGLDAATAIAALAALQLVGTVTGVVVDLTVNPGAVSIQGTPPSTIVNQGSVVNLTLSQIFPNIYPSIQATTEALSAAGFVVAPVIVYAYSSTVPDGFVISIQPISGTTLQNSGVVQLTVSLGPPNPVATTSVPNVVGMLVLDAEKAIVAAQCAVAAVNWTTSSTVLPSTVISQTPAAIGPVYLWTQVTLLVSSGPLIQYPNTGSGVVPPLPP